MSTFSVLGRLVAVILALSLSAARVANGQSSCSTNPHCLFSSLDVNATYSNGVDFAWYVRDKCIHALGGSTLMFVQLDTPAATRFCSTNITAASNESGMVACRGLVPNSAYFVVIQLGSCARRTVSFTTSGTCNLRSASLDCAAGVLSFRCWNGSSVVVEVRRPTEDQYAGLTYPDDWTSVFLNISTSPFTVTNLQPLDQVRLKTVFGSWNLSRWIAMSCPPPGFFNAPSSPTCSLRNVAVYGSASQSSTHYPGFAGRAIDGNTSSLWLDGSVSLTLTEPQPWWKVSLDQLYSVSQLVLYPRTDGCCLTRLANFDITLRDPYGAVAVTRYQSTAVTTPLTVTLSAFAISSSVTVQLRGTDKMQLAEVAVNACPTQVNVTCASATDGNTAQVVCPIGTVVTNVTEARYGVLTGSCAGVFTASGFFCSAPRDVRVAVSTQCVGKAVCTMTAWAASLGTTDLCVGSTKTLAIRVICGCLAQNVAVAGTASQSSTNGSAVAARAIDGSTNGSFALGSVTLTTNATAQPWWKVVLDQSYEVGSVVIHPRTDCCQARLANFDVTLRDASENLVATVFVGPAVTAPLTLTFASIVATSVTIQLRSTNPLSLAEVQVMSCRSVPVTSTACMLGPDSNSIRLDCPANQVITGIMEAVYGRLTNGSCGSSFTWDPTCTLDVAHVFVSQALNARFAVAYVSPEMLTGVDPCPGSTKYLGVRATCGSTPVTTSKTEPCMQGVDGSSLVLTCPPGQVIANITDAVYGTATGSCASGFSSAVACAVDVTSELQDQALGLPSFVINVSPAFLGGFDPCPGTTKQLFVRAQCVIGSGLPSGVATCSIATDGSKAALQCSAGEVITAVTEANYGTVSGSCGTTFTTLPTCNVNVSSAVLRLCYMRDECDIPVWASTFADAEPCIGVVKALAVRVQCARISQPTVGGACAVAPDGTNATLTCPAGQFITGIVRSEYGFIAGSCATRFWTSSDCAAPFLNTRMLLGRSCLGQQSCSVPSSPDAIGYSDCPSAQKSLSATITCGPRPCGSTSISQGASCIDLNFGANLDTGVGVNVIPWNCTGAQNQNWLIVPRADGTSAQLVNSLTGLCAGVAVNSYWDPVLQTPCDRDSLLQAWTLRRVGTQYAFQLKNSVFCIWPTNFAPILYVLFDCASPLASTQLFTLSSANFASCPLTVF